jgi:hypothetical protein
MRSDGVAVTTPGFDHDAGLGRDEEDFAVEQLVTRLAVEAPAVAVLPGAAGLDVGGVRVGPKASATTST